MAFTYGFHVWLFIFVKSIDILKIYPRKIPDSVHAHGGVAGRCRSLLSMQARGLINKWISI
jgi:hypothetical protein